MYPTEVNPNQGRTYKTGARYYLREDGHLIPRSLSEFETPKGYTAVIAVSETDLKRDPGSEDDRSVFDVADASQVQGNQISFDHAGSPERKQRTPVQKAQKAPEFVKLDEPAQSVSDEELQQKLSEVTEQNQHLQKQIDDLKEHRATLPTPPAPETAASDEPEVKLPDLTGSSRANRRKRGSS